MRRIIETGNEVGDCITLLVAKINGREAADRHIGHFAFRPGNMHKLLHRRLGRVGPESGLLAYPVSAFPSDGALSKLVAELDLEFRTIKAAFSPRLGNEKLPTFLPETVGYLGGYEGWCRENELQAVDLREFRLQSFKRALEEHL